MAAISLVRVLRPASGGSSAGFIAEGRSAGARAASAKRRRASRCRSPSCLPGRVAAIIGSSRYDGYTCHLPHRLTGHCLLEDMTYAHRLRFPAHRAGLSPATSFPQAVDVLAARQLVPQRSFALPADFRGNASVTQVCWPSPATAERSHHRATVSSSPIPAATVPPIEAQLYACDHIRGRMSRTIHQ